MVREFQEHMVVVIAAAEAGQSSQEHPAWGHGAFTKTFLEALDGRADGLRGRVKDGTVALDEVIDYVKKEVPVLAGTVNRKQQPTVSPQALLKSLSLPLARVRPAPATPTR